MRTSLPRIALVMAIATILICAQRAPAQNGPSDDEHLQQARGHLEQARQHMQDGQDGLRKHDPRTAEESQIDAKKELVKAKRELEKLLAQLYRMTQEEQLASLEVIFRDMLVRQEWATKETLRLDGITRSAWTRVEVIGCENQAEEERLLGEQALRAWIMVMEDGTTIVLPKTIAGLRDDLREVQAWLAAQRTGDFTQVSQQNIEQTLRDLIDAVGQARRARMGSPSDPPIGLPEEDPPLLPGSGELKLLRAAQLRVNAGTRSFEQDRPDGAAATDPLRQAAIGRIAEMQREVQATADELAKKFQ